MRYLFLLVFLPFLTLAQQHTIKGVVRNGASQALPGVSIQLYDSLQNAEHTSITDDQGYFEIPITSPKTYRLSTSHIGYLTYETYIPWDTSSDTLVIELQQQSTDLEEVTVTAKRPSITRKIDRLEFDVQNSNISSFNSWEILKRTPLIKVTGASLSIKGSNQILVMINDKKVLLSGDELKTMLENTPGEDIQRIEVITNPPAKYEASGSAIINIKMKQNELYGYRGILLAKAEQSNYGKQIGSLTNYYRTEKINLRATYNFGRGTYARYGSDYVRYASDQTTWVSEMTRIDRNNNQQTAILSADYSPDSTLMISLGWNASYSPRSQGIYRVPTLIYNQDQVVESSYLTTNDHHRSNRNNNFFLQASKKLNAHSSIDWSTYYTRNSRSNFQDILTELDFKDQKPETSHFLSDNNTNTRLLSSQVDIGFKKEKISLETGAKWSQVTTFSGLDFSDDEDGTFAYRPEKSADFDYKEQNIAGYGSLSYELPNWSLQAGLRGEYTKLKGLVSQPSDVNSNAYFTLFPTLYALYKAKDESQWGFSYGKRISRPSYSWLNPAKSYYNLFSYFHGDPRLRATIIHNLNLSFTKNNWNAELFYRYNRWPNMEISYQDDASHNMIYHYTNIEKDQGAGIDVSKNLTLTPWWSLNAMATGMYQENYFEGADQKIYKNDVFLFNSTVTTSLALDKNSDWNLELGNSYYSPSIQGPFRISAYSSTHLVMNRKFWNKKLDASLYFLDIFKSEQIKVASKYANQDNYYLDYSDSRKISFTLRFHFGNQTLRSTKNIKRIEEQDRI